MNLLRVSTSAFFHGNMRVEMKIYSIFGFYLLFVDDIELVKIELWDVVDKARFPIDTRTGLPDSKKSLKTSNSQKYLDSNSFDVYKDASAVVFLLNVAESFSSFYFQSELPRVPSNLPILIFVQINLLIFNLYIL